MLLFLRHIDAAGAETILAGLIARGVLNHAKEFQIEYTALHIGPCGVICGPISICPARFRYIIDRRFELRDGRQKSGITVQLAAVGFLQRVSRTNHSLIYPGAKMLGAVAARPRTQREAERQGNRMERLCFQLFGRPASLRVGLYFIGQALQQCWIDPSGG